MSETKALSVVYPPADIIKISASLPPRDLDVVQKNICSIATRTPEMARQCIYCVPVGKRNGVQTFELGPSIRLAEIGQNQFQRMWVRESVIEQTESKVVVEAICFDLQSTILTTAIAESAIYRGRSTLAIKAACSIARRDALIKQIRPQLDLSMPQIKARIISELCKEKMSLADAWKNACDELSEMYGFTTKQLERLVVRKKDMKDKIVIMIGIKNGLDEGTLKVDDVIEGHKSGKPTVTPDQVGEAPQSQTKNKNKKDVKKEFSFVDTALLFAKKAGLDEGALSGMLNAEFSISGGIRKVKKSDQESVISYLKSLAGN